MKIIGFITTNKVLAQSLTASVEKYPDLEMKVHLLLNPHQAVLDAEVLKIDAAIVDVAAGNPKQTSAVRQICEDLHRAVPGCRILLLVPQDITEARDIAMEAVLQKAANDYVFYDVSLDYLLTKLLAL